MSTTVDVGGGLALRLNLCRICRGIPMCEAMPVGAAILCSLCIESPAMYQGGLFQGDYVFVERDDQDPEATRWMAACIWNGIQRKEPK